MENKEYKYVKFLPWVGEYYKSGDGFQGKKILILGESHYCKEDDNRTHECKLYWKENGGKCSYNCMNKDCYSMTERLIKGEYLPFREDRNAYILDKEGKRQKKETKHLQTLLCFERNVLNKYTSREESIKFWHSIAFYNYMQHAQSGTQRPLENSDKENYEAAFNEVLNYLKPNYIIVWGKRLHNNNLLPDSEVSTIKVGKYEIPIRKFAVEYGVVQALIVEHPCCPCGKSRKKWHPILKEFLKLDE
ncbi:MAG: hypothetical protein E7140_05295 [Rikenellaceae bacterium]|nr:hypothetical protein [Rikenellaceae bacterium]